MRSPLGLASPLVFLVTIFAASGLPAPAHAQTRPRTVTLPTTGLTLTVPGGWQANESPVDVVGVLRDEITRTLPGLPTIDVILTPALGMSCEEWRERRQHAGGRLLTSPPFLPTQWFATAFQGTQASPDTKLVSACLPGSGGSIHAEISFDASGPLDPDLQWVTPVLTRVANAASDAKAPERPGRTTRLRAAMVELVLPDGWAAGIGMGHRGMLDRIQRLRPAEGNLAVELMSAEESDCGAWEASLRSRGELFLERPGFLPPSYHPMVHVYDGETVAVCLPSELSPRVAVLRASPGFTPAAGQAFQPALAAIAAAPVRLPGLAIPEVTLASWSPPATPPVALPPPLPAPDDGPITVPDDGGDSGGDVLDYPRFPLLNGIHLDLVVSHLAPEPSEPYDAQQLIYPVFDAEIIAGGRYIGFYARFGGHLGLSTALNLPFDAHVGVGPGLTLGPLALAPFAGVGIDALSLGGDDTFGMDPAFYWMVGGRIRLGTIAGVGLEGTGVRTFRGAIDATAAEDVGNVSTVAGGLFYRGESTELRGSFQWQGYEREAGMPNATGLGGLLGLGWPFE